LRSTCRAWAWPRDYDYTWTGLGGFCAAAIDALGLDRFHLVVHDIGGPVGFELAAAMPGRIRSLTILNTLLHVASFKRPWVMEPFAHRGVGEAWLASMNRVSFPPLMWWFGVQRRGAVPLDELLAYVPLLKGDDRGRAFLKIMRGFERTPDKERLYVGTLQAASYPIRIVWGANDPAIPLREEAVKIARTLGDLTVHELPGKHFFQEDCAPQIARHVAENAKSERPSQEAATHVVD
jgi:pimeloyl-ACP methyl ester carboxylesterase